MRSSSSGSSFSESSRDRYGSTFGSSDSGRRPSFARSFVRTDSSGSPSSEPTQPRSIWTSGPYGQLGAVREAAALEPGHALGRELAELGQEARLADAGVAEQEEHLAAAVRELVDDRLQAPDLLVSADERRQRGRLGRGLRADEAPGLDRLVAALHRQLAERLEHEGVQEALRRGLADRDRARLGRRLQPRRDVRRVAERNRLRIGVADQAHRGLARVDADAQVEVGDAPRGFDLPRVVRRRRRRSRARPVRRARGRPRARAGARRTPRCRRPCTPARCRRTARRSASCG